MFEKKYHVMTWKGNEILITAKQLYERILEDSKSDYNWIASATELVGICSTPDFPKEYAKGIKIAILNCFANLEMKQEYPSRGNSTDAKAVYYCYHSLDKTSKDALKAKKKYLTNVIAAIVKYDRVAVRAPIHHGLSYKKVCEEWKTAKFDEYFHIENINFESLREDLYKDFDKTIRRAEKEGVFKEDDEKHLESMRKFWNSLNLKENSYL